MDDDQFDDDDDGTFGSRRVRSRSAWGRARGRGEETRGGGEEKENERRTTETARRHRWGREGDAWRGGEG